MRLILLASFLGAVLLAGGVLLKLNDRVEHIQTAENSDPHWIAAELSFEILRFEAVLRDYVLNPALAQEVTTRFDIAWSRINVAQTGRMAELVDSFAVDDSSVGFLEVKFKELEPTIFNLPGENSSIAERRLIAEAVINEIEEHKLGVRQFSQRLAQARSQFMWSYRNGLLSLSHTIGFLGLAILIIATFFTIVLLFELRASRRNTMRMQKLAVEAEAASQAKDKFMSAVSHELRTPLTSILGGIQLIKAKHGESLSDDVLNLIAIAERNSVRLLALINDILDAQSILERKVVLEKEIINLKTVTEYTIENCNEYARFLHVEYSFLSECDDLRVCADERRVSQVLSNFLSNAAKFTSSGDVIEIRAYRQDGWARIDVIDHGRGIPEREHFNIFTRFHQVNPGTSGANKSSGLGLSISKELIEMNDGEIGVKSSEGRGSTFWFALPLVKEGQTDCENQRQI